MATGTVKTRSAIGSDILSELKELTAAVKELNGSKAEIDIDTKKANKKLNEYKKNLEGATKSLGKGGQMNYFATQEKMLEHLTDAWEELSKAQTEAEQKKSKGRIMNWANAYRAMGYDEKKVNKQIFEVADQHFKSYEGRRKDGSIYNSQSTFSVDDLKKVFSEALKQGADIHASESYWQQRNGTKKAEKRAVKQQIEEIEKEAKTISFDDLYKVDEAGIKERIRSLRESLGELTSKYNTKGLGKTDAEDYVKFYLELENYLKKFGKTIPKELASLAKDINDGGKYGKIFQSLKDYMDLDNDDNKSEKGAFSFKDASRKATGRVSRTLNEASIKVATSRKQNGKEPSASAVSDGAKAATENAKQAAEALEEQAKAQEQVNEAQKEGNKLESGSATTEKAKEAAAALTEEKKAQDAVNAAKDAGKSAGATSNTAIESKKATDALKQQAKAQEEVNKQEKESSSSQSSRSAETKAKTIKEQYEDTIKLIHQLEAKQAQLLGKHEATDNAYTKALEAKRRADAKGEDFEKGLSTKDDFIRVIKDSIKEKNYDKAAAYLGLGTEVGKQNNFKMPLLSTTRKDGSKHILNEELMIRYNEMKDEANVNLGEVNRELNEINQRLLIERENAKNLKMQLLSEEGNEETPVGDGKATKSPASAQKPEWQNDLDDKEIKAVEVYIKRLKTLRKEAYDESQALQEALNLLDKFKSNDVAGILETGSFKAKNSPESLMLAQMTGMPVNQKDLRNQAIRSINPEAYDQLFPQSVQGTEQALADVAEQEHVVSDKAKELANTITKDFGIKGKEAIQSIAIEIDKIIESASKGETTSFDNLISKLSEYYKLTKDEKSDLTGQYDQLRAFISKSKIHKDSEMQAEFGDDWNLVRNTIGSRVVSATGGSDIMTVLREANDTLGTTFDLTTSNAEGWRQLYEALQHPPKLDVFNAFRDLATSDSVSVINMITDSIRELGYEIKKTGIATDEDGFATVPTGGDGFDEDDFFGEASRQAHEFREAEEQIREESSATTRAIEIDNNNVISSTEDLISVIKELEEIYNKFERAKYSERYGGNYIDELRPVEGLDTSDYDSSHATQENIESTRSKMMEIYNLYKKVTSAIKNNNGYYKGIQYDTRDQERLIENFKAYAQNYHELVTEYNAGEAAFAKDTGFDPQYFETLDVVVSKLTRDFKAYAQEVITDSASVQENNRLYEEEHARLEESNAILRERYNLLRDLVLAYAKNNGFNFDARSQIGDLIPYIADANENWQLQNWGEDLFGNQLSTNVLNDILKILGIEIPEAAGRAKEAISEVIEESTSRKSAVTGRQLYEQMAGRFVSSTLAHQKNTDFSMSLEDNFQGLIDTALLPWRNIRDRGLMSKSDFDFSKDIFDSTDHNEISLAASEAIQKIMGATKNHFQKIADAIVQYYNEEIPYSSLADITRKELQDAYARQTERAKIKEPISDETSVSNSVEDFKSTWTKAVLKSTEPPEALSRAYMQYIQDINSGAISAEDAMTGMEKVARRLDVAFDEASQKWQKIQFSPEIQANLDAFNKAMPSYEDGVSGKTFDDTRKKYEELINAIKYDSKSAEDAIKEMLQAIEDAAKINGDPWRINSEPKSDITSISAYYGKYEPGKKQKLIDELTDIAKNQVINQITRDEPSKGFTGQISTFTSPNGISQQDIDRINSYREILQKLGYTLDEIKWDDHTYIASAKIIPIDENAVKTAEEMRRILFDIRGIEEQAQPSPAADQHKEEANAAEEAAKAEEELARKKEETAKAGKSNGNAEEEKKTADAARETAKAGEEAGAGIKVEADSAKEAKKNKDDMTAANKNLADSMRETAKAGKEAGDGINAERDAVGPNSQIPGRRPTPSNGDNRLIRETWRGDNALTATYELSKGLTRTERYGWQENEETGEGGWVLQQADEVADYNALLKETIGLTKQLVQAQASWNFEYQRGSDQSVLDALESQMVYFQNRIRQNNELAQSYADRSIAPAGGYTHQQYVDDVYEQTEQLYLDQARKSASQLQAEAARQQRTIEQANTWISNQLEKVRDLNNKYDSAINSEASKGIKNPTDLSQYQAQAQDLIDFIEGLRGASIDAADADRVTELIGSLKRLGDNLFAKGQAATGDLSKQDIDIQKSVLSSRIDTFIAGASRSNGDVSGVIEQAEKLKANLASLSSGKQVTDSFAKLKALKAELQSINEEQKTFEETVVDKIIGAYDARTKMTNAETSIISGGETPNNILKMTNAAEELARAEDEASDAYIRLIELWDDGKISDDQFTALYEIYTTNGSEASRKSKQIAEAKAQQKAIDELAATYKKLAEAEEKASYGADAVAKARGKAEVENIKARQTELEKQIPEDVRTEEQKEQLKIAQSRVEDLKNAYDEARGVLSAKGLGFEEGKDVEKTWDTLIRKAQQYQNILQKQGSGKTLTVNEMKFLTELRDLYDQAGEKAEEAGEKGEKFNQAMDAARANIRDQVVGNYSNVIGQMDSASKNKPAAYNDQVQQLQANLERLRSTDFGNDEWFETIEKLDAGIKKINSDLNAKPIDESARITLNRQMSEWIAKNGRAGEFADQVRQLQDELAKADSQGALQKVSDGFEKIKKDAIEAGKVGQTFADGLIKRFKSLGQYLLSFASFYRVIGMFKQAFSIVKELDTGLMEVRKVSSESLSSLKEWQATTFDQANAVGGTAAQIESSTAAWLRLGKSFTEAQEAAQASVELLNVSEFTSIDDATTSLVSMRQAFEDLSYEDFIDKLNAVGDNFSSSTDQLAYGMRNVSSVLKVAGNDIDQSLALLTAAKFVGCDAQKYASKNIFNCVDYLKAHPTIAEKSRYDGLTMCVWNNG